MDAVVVEAVLADWKTAPVSKSLRAALQLVDVMTRRPQEVDAELIDEIRAAGLTRGEVEEVATVVFHFNFINRVADAMDFPMPKGKEASRQANVLSLMARVATGGQSPEPSWQAGADGLCRPAELEESRERLFSTPGAVDCDLRRRIEARAAALLGAPRTEQELPESIEEYVKLLALHAFQIHDGTVDRMKSAGYTDEQIFEITLVAAFGAALPGQERLFGVLYNREDRA